jgi:steroid 5-alpha reductase family enzyme
MDMLMLNWSNYFDSLLAMLIFALLGWLISLVRKKVSHVDSMWSLFFLIAGLVVSYYSTPLTSRAWVVMALLLLWSIRLAVYIAWRNKGHEDARYQVIRENNEPYFWLKSIYIVFALQALLAGVVSMVLFVAIQSQVTFSSLDTIATSLVMFGLAWEIIADWQLTSFKQNPENAGKVLESGLWRYSRHPNYFGECCVWWGFYLFALAAGAWWSIISPMLMTLLLLKVSGVSLLESTINSRRPEYAEYIKKTNAFIPGPRKNA